MTRGNLLQKSDIQKQSRRNVLALSYNGKVKARVARLHGHDENTFFVVNINAIPIPDEIEELAQKAGTTLAHSPTEDSFRRLVAEAIIAEAIENAPEHLFEITGAAFSWPDATLVSLERETREREERVDGLIREVRLRLRAKLSERIPVFDWVPPSTDHAPATAPAPVGKPSVAHEAAAPEPEPDVEFSARDEALRPSDAVIAKIREAVRAIREKDVPQRLPAGARKVVEAAAPGVLIWTAGKAIACPSLADALVAARAHALKKSAASQNAQETVVIDWDGEQPVLVRRFRPGSGATAYRCEDFAKPAKAEAQEEHAEQPAVVEKEA
jgi:hypothetical protein